MIIVKCQASSVLIMILGPEGWWGVFPSQSETINSDQPSKNENACQMPYWESADLPRGKCETSLFEWAARELKWRKIEREQWKQKKCQQNQQEKPPTAFRLLES